jgi:hypothetical protein
MMKWEDLLKALAIVIIWILGIYLREYIYHFMRKK